MSRRHLGAALLAGALALGTTMAVRAVTSSTAEPAGTTTTPATTQPVFVWIDEAELAVAPVVVVPTEMHLDAGLLEIGYDMVSMVGDGVAIRASHWTLLAGEDEFPADSDGISTRAIFDVGTSFDVASISGLRLDRYWSIAPIQASFRPAIDDFSAHEIAPGVNAALDLVQRQATGALIRVRVTASGLGQASDLAVDGVGPGWTRASTNFGGGGLWTITFEGMEVPDPLPLQIRGLIWLPIDTAQVSDLDGVPLV